ncbi:ATP-binding protein [Ferruginibacter paludis]|uniref:ATP-binding protein n=1 Tax=Ferruginibacter paludis TaxID=1310417 RepID=UPI0025B3A8CA|nr:ATP-binding protein [Ferruginibacter paludis]MDN3654119.1 ATP-binding protein [Ferruginibacter paludis]
MAFSRRQLRSIIYNLLNNSLKYKSAVRRPAILIQTARENEDIVIIISDNGIGIEKNKHEAVFTKYFRLDNALEGSGIGLYLVKELVKNAGGDIALQSKPDEGTVIRIILKNLKIASV